MMVVNTGLLLAKHCDAYVQSINSGYEAGGLQRIISTSRCAKARLLHYFPTDELLEEAPSAAAHSDDHSELSYADWCGWHLDHGSLTGLVPALFLNAEGHTVPCPDTDSGLWIRSRKGALVKVAAPPGCLLFQVHPRPKQTVRILHS